MTASARVFCPAVPENVVYLVNREFVVPPAVMVPVACPVRRVSEDPLVLLVTPEPIAPLDPLVVADPRANLVGFFVRETNTNKIQPKWSIKKAQ